MKLVRVCPRLARGAGWVLPFLPEISTAHPSGRLVLDVGTQVRLGGA